MTAIFAALALAITATPVYWPAARMAATIQHLNYPASSGATVSNIHCRGLGKPIRHTYQRFTCQVTVTPNGNGTPNIVSVWVSPRPHGRVCGSLDRTVPCEPIPKP